MKRKSEAPKRGAVVCATGEYVGIVQERVKDKHGWRNRLGRIGLNGRLETVWVYDESLWQPDEYYFSNLVRHYDSCAVLRDVVVELTRLVGKAAAGTLQGQLEKMMTDAALKISKHPRPHQPDLGRVMLDFGHRARFSDKAMAQGRAIVAKLAA